MPEADLTDKEQGLVDYISEAATELLRVHRVPGCSIAIATRGQVRWRGAFGEADPGKGLPMRTDTVARSGSMGKTYTATAVMQLVEAGVLDLAGDVSDYVGFPVVNPLGERQVQLLDLLTHRSGLAGNAASSHYGKPPALEEHLRKDLAGDTRDYFAGTLQKWTKPVGEQMQYSNTGMALLGLIVQRMNPDQLSFSDYVQRHIIDRLGMTDTQFPPVVNDAAVARPDLLARVSAGQTAFGGLQFPALDVTFADYPAGLVLTTPTDHVRVLLAYLNGGALDGSRILQTETVRQMLTPTMRLGGAPVQPGEVKPDEVTAGGFLGLVWWMGDLGLPTEWFGHGGAHMWGWVNEFRAFPRLDLAIAVFANNWDVARYLSGTPTPALNTTLITLASSYLAESEARPATAWAWKRSYAAGVAAGVLNHGVLSIPEPTTPEMLSASLSGVRDVVQKWDANAFRAGFNEITANGPLSLEDVDDFFASGRCRLTTAELNAVWPDLGGTGLYPLPMGPGMRSELS